MRSKFAFLTIAILLISTVGVTTILSGEDNMAGTRISVFNSYHSGYIYVNLTHPNGSPAEKYEVSSINVISTGCPYKNITDENGKTEIRMPFDLLGLCNLHVNPLFMGYFHKEQFLIGPDEHVYFDIVVSDQLPSINSISGIVRNASSGDPVPGVVLDLYGYDQYGNVVSKTNTTTADGSYEFLVPNSTEPYRIQTDQSSLFGFYHRYVNVFIRSGKTVYEMDFSLLPVYKAKNPMGMRFINSTTGKIFKSGSLDISGLSSSRDHTYYYQYFYKPDVNGWFNARLDPGEYSCSWSDYASDTGVGVSWSSYIIVNSTGYSDQIPIEVPGFVKIDLEVWNATSPLQYCYNWWYSEISSDRGMAAMRSSKNTDINGKMDMWIRDDEPTEIFISKSGHKAISLVVDPDDLPVPPSYNLTLETESYEPAKMGDLRVVVVDDETGLHIPYATILFFRDDDYGMPIAYLANETGVWEGTVRIGTLSLIQGETGLGIGEIKDVLIKNGSNPDVEIRIERSSLGKDWVESYLRVIDPQGVPLPGIQVNIYFEDGRYGKYYSTITDGDGIIWFKSPPGKVTIYDTNTPDEYRDHWKTGYLEIEVPPGGGKLDDITAYSAYPLEEINGFVKDGVTGEPIEIAYVNAISCHLMEEADGYDPMINSWIDPRAVQLSWLQSGSSYGGFYRVWGKDEVYVTAMKGGYFGHAEWIDLSTRAATRHNIELFPMPEFSTSINGTLVDENGEEIRGYVRVYDSVHDSSHVSWIDVDLTGNFSIPIYEGNIKLIYGNQTLEDEIKLEVGEGGVHDLVLQLIPESGISGVVTNWSWEALEGINVTLVEIGEENNETIAWMLTDQDGGYSFTVPEGTYRLDIEITDLFDAYSSGEIVTDGWDDIDHPIILNNRSIADIYGTIIGEGGPQADGISDVVVDLYHGENLIGSNTTDEGGHFSFLDIDHDSNYWINATPSEDAAGIADMKPGYLGNRSANFTVEGRSVEVEISLPYIDYQPPEWLEIISYGPEGDGVHLDEPIRITFSHEMNRTGVEEVLSIVPAVGNLSFQLSHGGTVLRIGHDPFSGNTTYVVTTGEDLRSADGYPLFNFTAVEWNFTTGESMSPWLLYNANVIVDENGVVIVHAEGKEGISVFIIIGSSFYELEETSPGVYERSINGSEFEWNTTYQYHFSDREGGPDMAPDLSGSFRTPIEPEYPVEWEITDAEVEIDSDGDWHVTVHGGENQSVYIVIPGVGSFLLEDDGSGVYTLEIDSDNFDWDEEYEYYFSNETGGEDLAPDLSGQEVMPEDPGSDDDDDNILERMGKGTLICCGAVLLLIVIILVVIFAVTLRGGKGKDWEDEE